MTKRISAVAAILAAAALAIACAQTDAGITVKVKSKLAADDTVKAYQINVDTQNKVVTLTGTVDTAAAKDQAVALARQTEGVADVVDNITVAVATAEPPPSAAERTARTAGTMITDASITAAVKGKLLADGTVAGLKIDVDTENGVVHLRGTVKSLAEKQQAMKLARETDGVKSVQDHLVIGESKSKYD